MHKSIYFLTFIIVIGLLIKSHAQTNLLKPIKLTSFLPLDSIHDVEISNTWKSKTYTLTKKGLSNLKLALSTAKAYNMPILKPGHLYMKIKFSNPNTLKSYDIYMYPDFIILDPDYLSKKPFYYIQLSKKIDWDRLNN